MVHMYNKSFGIAMFVSCVTSLSVLVVALGRRPSYRDPCWGGEGELGENWGGVAVDGGKGGGRCSEMKRLMDGMEEIVEGK